MKKGSCRENTLSSLNYVLQLVYTSDSVPRAGIPRYLSYLSTYLVSEEFKWMYPGSTRKTNLVRRLRVQDVLEES